MYEDSCGHRSAPVETDESMTSSSLNLAWSACLVCQESVKPGRTPVMDEWSGPPVTINEPYKLDYPDEPWGESPCGLTQSPISAGLELSPGLTPHQPLEINDPSFIAWMEEVPRKDSPVQSYYKAPKEPLSIDPGSLEAPRSLRPDPSGVCQRPLPCYLPCCSNLIPPQCKWTPVLSVGSRALEKSKVI